MAWSTRQLAELANTTVNAVRHYHRAGLLDEPVRHANGYKRYEARHLAVLVRIRRLREAGVPLAQVERMGAGPEERTRMLQEVEADLTAGIDRMQKAREQVVAMLREPSELDAPPGFGSVARRLSDADRSIIGIYSMFFDGAAMEDIRRMIEIEPADIDAEYARLTEEASEGTRQDLAERLAPLLSGHLDAFPWLGDPAPHRTRSGADGSGALTQALTELYNTAQLDVLRRALVIVDRVRSAPR